MPTNHIIHDAPGIAKKTNRQQEYQGKIFRTACNEKAGLSDERPDLIKTV